MENLKSKRLLISEDEPALGKLYVDFFTRLGCEVTYVRDGVQALDQFKKSQFDIILTDIRMPKKTGIDVLERLARYARQGKPTPKLIVITGLLGEGEPYLKSLGVEAVFQKPVDLKEVAGFLSLSFSDQYRKGA